MLDKTIPYKNIIMKWDGTKWDETRWDGTKWGGTPKETTGVRPSCPGKIVSYCPGNAEEWVRIQMEAGEFLDLGRDLDQSRELALDYFRTIYETDLDSLKERCLFFIDETGEKVGTCMAWRERDEKRTPSVHWLAVSKKAQGRGIGSALLERTLELFGQRNETPVWLHTQPWSYKAVGLYLRAGFRFCQKETFGGYENQNKEAVEILQRYMILPRDAWTLESQVFSDPGI